MSFPQLLAEYLAVTSEIKLLCPRSSQVGKNWNACISFPSPISTFFINRKFQNNIASRVFVTAKNTRAKNWMSRTASELIHFNMGLNNAFKFLLNWGNIRLFSGRASGTVSVGPNPINTLKKPQRYAITLCYLTVNRKQFISGSHPPPVT